MLVGTIHESAVQSIKCMLALLSRFSVAFGLVQPKLSRILVRIGCRSLSTSCRRRPVGAIPRTLGQIRPVSRR